MNATLSGAEMGVEVDDGGCETGAADKCDAAWEDA